ERLQNLLFVVDEQNRPAMRHEWASRSIRISVPHPGELDTAIVPPRPSTMFLAIGRPRPVPPRLVVKYGSNTCARSLGAIPTPRSATTMRNRSPLARLDNVTAGGVASGTTASAPP